MDTYFRSHSPSGAVTPSEEMQHEAWELSVLVNLAGVAQDLRFALKTVIIVLGAVCLHGQSQSVFGVNNRDERQSSRERERERERGGGGAREKVRERGD